MSRSEAMWRLLTTRQSCRVTGTLMPDVEATCLLLIVQENIQNVDVIVSDVVRHEGAEKME